MENSELGHIQHLAEVGKQTSELFHEMNNNFMIIIGLLDLINYKYTNVEMPLKDCLHKIHRYVDKSIELMETTLDKSKKEQYHVTFAEINELIDSIVSSVQHCKDFQKVELTSDAEHALCEVFINLADLENVIINIIKNARDAINSGRSRGRIHIETHIVNEALLIEISDNGPGVPMSVQEKIFEPFYTTKANDKGIGLGLSICKSIILNYGGQLYLDENHNKGAKFVIKLPLQ